MERSRYRGLFSQEDVKNAIAPKLTYSESQLMDYTFGTDYSSSWTSKNSVYSWLPLELQRKVVNLMVNSNPLRIKFRQFGSIKITESERFHQIINEVAGYYYLTEDGKIYIFVGEPYDPNIRLVPHPESVNPIHHILSKDNNNVEAVDSEGNLYFLGNVLRKTQQPYPVRNMILIHYLGMHPMISVPKYLGLEGQYGNRVFPGAIKVLLHEPHGILSFLKENGTADFYFYNNLDQLRFSDSVGDLVDINFVDGNNFIGLTNTHKLVGWDVNGNRWNFPIPQSIGRIIRIGYRFVLDEYGTLYIIGLNRSWIKASNDYEFSQITGGKQVYHGDSGDSNGAAGKKLSSYVDLNTEFARHVQIITTDIYGNQLVKYTYTGNNSEEMRKAWIHPKTPNHQPVNVSSTTSIEDNNGRTIPEMYPNFFDFGPIYAPGESNTYYVVLLSQWSDQPTVKLVRGTF